MSVGSRSNSSSSSSEFSLSGRSASSGLSYPSASMDLTKFHDSAHAHDFQQPLSRIVMVRKMEQRTYVAASKQGQVNTFHHLNSITFIYCQWRGVLCDVSIVVPFKPTDQYL